MKTQSLQASGIAGLQASTIGLQTGTLPATTTAQFDVNELMNLMIVMMIMVMMMRMMTKATESVY